MIEKLCKLDGKQNIHHVHVCIKHSYFIKSIWWSFDRFLEPVVLDDSAIGTKKAT
jgi:hypothetical protein